MKHILESPDVMAAYAEIDLCYIGLQMLANEKPPTSMEAAIDKACGRNLKAERIANTIEIIERLIENKKLIDADYSGDLAMLEQVKKIAA